MVNDPRYHQMSQLRQRLLGENEDVLNFMMGDEEILLFPETTDEIVLNRALLTI